MMLWNTLTRLSDYTPTPPFRMLHKEARREKEARPIVPPIKIATTPVNLSDRWGIVGKTGSGKTFFTHQLAKRLRANYPFAHLYILDTKGAGDFDHLRQWTFDSKYPPPPFHKTQDGIGGIQVWQPPTNNRRYFGDWFENIFNARKPAVVWLDDVAPVATKVSQPEYFNVIQKVGRGLNIGMISLIQESVDVPRTILSQANHLVSFRVSNDYDKRFLKNKLELKKEYAVHHKYGFWHSCLDDTEEARYYGSFESFF